MPKVLTARRLVSRELKSESAQNGALKLHFVPKFLNCKMLDERPPERAAASRLILAMAARARLRAAKLVHVLGEIAEKNAAAEILQEGRHAH